MLNRGTIFLGLMLTGSLALASLMREDKSSSSEVVLPAPRASSVSHKPDDNERAALPALQLEKLVRSELTEPEHNPFAGRSWNVPPPLPPVIPTLKAEQPAAPSMPFRYMGRIQEEGGRPVVFFTQGSQAYAVSEGEAIDDTYRLESVLPTQLVLVYLPLKTKQTINVGPLEMDSDESFNDTSSDAANALLRDTEAGQIAGSERQ